MQQRTTKNWRKGDDDDIMKRFTDSNLYSLTNHHNYHLCSLQPKLLLLLYMLYSTTWK